MLANAVHVTSRVNRFHPIKNYLNKIRGTWDGQERLSNWIVDVFKPPLDIDLEYLSLIGSKFLIASIARILKPGCKVDNLLILESEQGRKKSTVVDVLFNGYVNDTPLQIGDKDAVMGLAGHWCVEIPELQGFSQTEDTRLKSFFATREDRIRLPYARTVESFPRQNVFIGTTNQTEYFKDHTGNRRYWPVRCTVVDIDYVLENREQLWAEALHKFEDGKTWWPETDNENTLLRVEQDKRMRIDPWQYLIEDFLNKRLFDWIQGNDILTDCINKNPSSVQKADQMRVGAIMQSIGWKNITKRVVVPGCDKKSLRRVYIRPNE